MAERNTVYKCEVCGNVVGGLIHGGGTLVCCGQNMTAMNEKTADSATEKHVPVVTKTADGFDVVVGSTLHPMTAEHWIQWIELQIGNTLLRQYLKPGDEPRARFVWSGKADTVIAREYCNLHGLWRG